MCFFIVSLKLQRRDVLNVFSFQSYVYSGVQVKSGGGVFIRDCSLVKPYPVLLFGGDIVVKHTEQALIVDDWISFQVVNDVSTIYRYIRCALLLINRRVTSVVCCMCAICRPMPKQGCYSKSCG